MTQLIGLSGGIGSGKTSVRQMLEELGAQTICADQVVHELQAAGAPMLDVLAEEFGPEILASDGSLNRKALGDVVFRDAKARARLGAIVHPPVVEEIARRTRSAMESQVPVAVVDIPLLFEGIQNQTGSAIALQYDALVLVWVPAETQIQRTVKRDSCTVEEAERRVAAQMPIDDKRPLATHIIDNSGPVSKTAEQVRSLWEQWSREEAPS